MLARKNQLGVGEAGTRHMQAMRTPSFPVMDFPEEHRASKIFAREMVCSSNYFFLSPLTPREMLLLYWPFFPSFPQVSATEGGSR